MENIDNAPGTPESPTTPTRSTGPRAQSPNSSYMRNYVIQDLPQQHVNARFNITTGSMGLERRSDTPTPGHEDKIIKSYERQFNTQSMSRIPASIKEQQQNVNFNNPATSQSIQSNLYTSSKSENLLPTKSLHMSSSPALEGQQSNFNNSNKTQNVQQQRAYSLPQSDIEQQQTSLFNKPLHRRLNSEQPTTSTATYPSSATLKLSNMTASLPSSPTADNPQCTHPSHSIAQIGTYLSDIPTSHFEQHLQKRRSESRGKSSEMNECLNDIFLKRLQDIDTTAYGDVNLKLVTYQEWVDMLLKVNEYMITNIEELESEVAERLEIVQRKVNINCRHSQGNELMKCRKDIDILTKFIRNAYHSDIWDLQLLNCETVNTAEILGLTEQQVDDINAEKGAGLQPRNSTDAESMHKNKLLANIKALAFEVAEKHDEVRELKRQVICMEDEIQQAQKKIHFKEDVIKELRNDLKCAHNKLNHRDSLETSLGMPPINYELQTARTNNISDCETLTNANVSEFECLSDTIHEENQKIKDLHDELLELLYINKECNDVNKNKVKRFTAICQKLQSEKVAAHSKLNFILNQLADLESECANDSDSGIHSKCEKDPDVKVLDSVRKLFRKLNSTITELRKTVHKLEMENSELSSNLQTASKISQCNGQTLKEIADLLARMIGQHFSYAEIYNSNHNGNNPFCEVIREIKKGYEEREIQLLRTAEERSNNIQELSLALLNNEKSFGEQQSKRLNIIDLEHLNKTTLPPTTPPPPIPTTTSTAATLLTDQEHDKTTSTSLQGLIEKKL